jgi:copper chaperone CopZ
LDVETDYQDHTATVTFDDTETDVGTIVGVLEKGGYPVKGQPLFLE